MAGALLLARRRQSDLAVLYTTLIGELYSTYRMELGIIKFRRLHPKIKIDFYLIITIKIFNLLVSIFLKR
jgi:hypothetical protein